MHRNEVKRVKTRVLVRTEIRRTPAQGAKVLEKREKGQQSRLLAVLVMKVVVRESVGLQLSFS